MASQPFSYTERLWKDLEADWPELLARNQPLTCGNADERGLHFTDPDSVIGDFCVHCWDEQIDIHWGWDLEHHHFLGCTEYDDQGFEMVYQHALESVVGTFTGEPVLLFCSNKTFDFGLRNELEDMKKELITPDRFQVMDNASGTNGWSLRKILSLWSCHGHGLMTTLRSATATCYNTGFSLKSSVGANSNKYCFAATRTIQG